MLLPQHVVIFSLSFSEQFASLLAASGSLLSVILVLVFIPYVPKQKMVEKSEEKSESVLNMSKIFGLIFAPGVTMLLLIKLICGIPIGIIQSMFSVIAIEQFGMPADQVNFKFYHLNIHMDGRATFNRKIIIEKGL